MQAVLIVEDDASVRSFMEVILNLEGYTVRTAATGAEALEIAATTVLDLVTIDLGLPDMPGVELSRRLRATPGGARARQLIVSGSEPTPEHEAHVDAVLAKPFDFAVFTEVVNRVAARPLPPDALGAELDRILTGRLVETHFQPIVHLATGRYVGFEALTRGPEGSPLHMPEELFAEAHRHGRLTELDSLCTVTAVRAVAGFRTPPPLVFFNVEPSTLAKPHSPEREAIANEPRSFRGVAEYTEGAVTRQLPVLLRNAERVRARGDIVALDDLGSDVRALAMLPLLKPEVVKLDLAVVQGPITSVQATIAVAVAAYAEQSGAAIVAEGIETQDHLAAAFALGAQLGQGFLLGAPAPAADWDAVSELDYLDVAPAAVPPSHSTARTPFEHARRSLAPRAGSGTLVAGISQQLSAQACAAWATRRRPSCSCRTTWSCRRPTGGRFSIGPAGPPCSACSGWVSRLTPPPAPMSGSSPPTTRWPASGPPWSSGRTRPRCSAPGRSPTRLAPPTAASSSCSRTTESWPWRWRPSWPGGSARDLRRRVRRRCRRDERRPSVPASDGWRGSRLPVVGAGTGAASSPAARHRG